MKRASKKWYEDWNIVTHALPLGITAKEISIPNSRADDHKKVVILYPSSPSTSDDPVRVLTLLLESALYELTKD